MNSTVTSTSAITINSATRFNNYNQSYTSPKQEKTMNSNTQTQNTIHMTEETLKATIAAAVAEALAQQQQQPAQQVTLTKEEALKNAWSTRATNKLGELSKKGIQTVGKGSAYVEVYTVPVVLATTAKVAATSGAVASSIGEKSTRFGDRCAEAAARRTPGATCTAETINAKVDYFNSLSEEEKIAFLAKNVVIK